MNGAFIAAGSRLPPRAFSIWVMPEHFGPLSNAQWLAAAPSFCATRTWIVPVANRNLFLRCSRTCAGLVSDGTRDPIAADHSLPILRANAQSFIARHLRNCAQAVSLDYRHSHQRSSQHCCGLCHAGPLPFLQPVNSAAAAPAIAIAWLYRSVDYDTPHEVRLAASSSRAPPV